MYITPQGTPATVTLYRCSIIYAGFGLDHFSSLDPNCEGQHVEGILGYLMTTWNNQCGPIWNSSHCYEWAQTTHSYLQSADTGTGAQQTFAWVEAHNNSHGIPSQNVLDPTLCTNQRTLSACAVADDEAWSHIVLASSTTQSKNALGAAVSATSTYSYSLTTLTSVICPDCTVGMYWGDENDGDYLDFYNTKFRGFNAVQEVRPDNSVVVHRYYTTEGIGVYDVAAINSQGKCQNGYRDSNNNPVGCTSSPYWDLANAATGREYQQDVKDTTGALLTRTVQSYQANCPPAGVSASPAIAVYGNWDGHLVSEVDPGNPVVACDVLLTSTKQYLSNGVAAPTDTNVPWSQVSYTYNSYGLVTSATTTGNDLSTTPTITTSTLYVTNDAINASTNPPTDIYMIDRVGFSDIEDPGNTTATRRQCTFTWYDGQAWTLGQTSGLTQGLPTKTERFADCGTAPNYNNGNGDSITSTSYTATGQVASTIDADAISAAHLDVISSVPTRKTPLPPASVPGQHHHSASVCDK